MSSADTLLFVGPRSLLGRPYQQMHRNLIQVFDNFIKSGVSPLSAWLAGCLPEVRTSDSPQKARPLHIAHAMIRTLAIVVPHRRQTSWAILQSRGESLWLHTTPSRDMSFVASYFCTFAQVHSRLPEKHVFLFARRPSRLPCLPYR
jgi:hypothetical protein